MAVLFEGTVTTTQLEGTSLYRDLITNMFQITEPLLDITFNGARYICKSVVKELVDKHMYYYGGYGKLEPVFTTYPFVIESLDNPTEIYLYTETAGTYILKIETIKAVNKVVYGSTVLVDLTDATATADKILQGYTAYGADGSKITGTATGSGIPILQNKTVSPSESQQSVQADSGYDGLDTVTVNAISLTYVGSGIDRKSSTDLIVSGATVTAPVGYYSAAASKSVATMTLPTSAASSATSGYTSKATIGRSTAAQYINIPPGYNSTGAYYVISAVANGSATAPASISGTAASVSTGTNTLTLTKTVSVTPTVSAGYVSAGTAGNSSVSLTASVTTKAAATITPTTTNQTIAADTYITGTQTIAGDADLVGSNILSTANIFGVQGTVVVQSYYTGSSAPASSLGQNGDIYLQE